MPQEIRFVATFRAEKWRKDNAVAAKSLGPTKWDCTTFVTKPPEWCQTFGEKVRDALVVKGHLEFLDRDDVLQRDPAAPEWVREWEGPFTIKVRLSK